MIYLVPRRVLDQTFDVFRECGQGRRECQVVWTSRWDLPESICECVHPTHRSHAGGFVTEDSWINDFWLKLAAAGLGIRVQIHTHPGSAFHSPTDDEFPIVHNPGFLSLVVPNFALGSVGFDGAYLSEIGPEGRWREISIESRIRII